MKTTNNLSTEVENNLIIKASLGDLDAFNELVLSYQSLAYHYANALVQDADLAEDITQESFIKAFMNIKKFRRKSFRAWLLKIVTNTAYDQFRQLKHHPTQSLFVENENEDEFESPAWLADPAASVEAKVEQNEQAKRLYELLDKLPEIYRNVITLVDLYELSYAEVSEILNLPLGTVKSRLLRARMQMRTKLQIDHKLRPVRNWEDGSTESGSIAAEVSASRHTYTEARIYTIQVAAADDDTGVTPESVMAVVDVPSEGFVTGGGGADKFLIKIWDAIRLVYDNMIVYPEDMYGTNPQVIGGGSIVIHNM